MRNKKAKPYIIDNNVKCDKFSFHKTFYKLHNFMIILAHPGVEAE